MQDVEIKMFIAGTWNLEHKWWETDFRLCNCDNINSRMQWYLKHLNGWCIVLGEVRGRMWGYTNFSVTIFTVQNFDLKIFWLKALPIKICQLPSLPSLHANISFSQVHLLLNHYARFNWILHKVSIDTVVAGHSNVYISFHHLWWWNAELQRQIKAK